MTHEEFKAWAAERLAFHMKEAGFKTTEEIDAEHLEGIIRRHFASAEDRAKDLRRAGISIRHVAVCLFKDKNTVQRMLNPESREKYNARMREYMKLYRLRKKAN